MKSAETIAAKEARRQYQNAWRAKNKERVKEYNRRYWQNVAEKQQTANQTNN